MSEELANSPEFMQWMVDEGQSSTESSLLTFDFTMQGVMGNLAGGDAAWALGYERREYNLEAKSYGCSWKNSNERIEGYL